MIHRDIKGGNVLLDGMEGPMIADFGVSQWLREPVAEAFKRKTRTLVGTTCFIAPEVLDTAEGYDCKVDIWSLGITALELAMGRAPYSDLDSEDVLVRLLTKKPPSFDSYQGVKGVADPSKFSRKFRDFVHQALLYSPEDRPSAAALLRHAFIAGAPEEGAFLAELREHVPDIPTEDVVSKALRLAKDALEGAEAQAIGAGSGAEGVGAGAGAVAGAGSGRAGSTRGRADSVSAELDVPLYKHLYAGVAAATAESTGGSPRRSGPTRAVSFRARTGGSTGAAGGGSSKGSSSGAGRGRETGSRRGPIRDAASLAIDKAMALSATTA